jgi:hypothetical protein
MMIEKAEPDPSSKCARCSIAFLDGEVALRDRGEWLHLRCARVLRTQERIRESSELRRRSAVALAESQERLARYAGAHDEPPAVLCIVCRTGIRSVTELIPTLSGPMHIRCRPGHRPAEPSRTQIDEHCYVCGRQIAADARVRQFHELMVHEACYVRHLQP